jgi:hypothetical protein
MALLLAAAEVALTVTPVLDLVLEDEEALDWVVPQCLQYRRVHHKMKRFGPAIGLSLL